MSGSPEDDSHNPFGGAAPAGGRGRRQKDPFDGGDTGDANDPFATGTAGEEEEETGENNQGTSDA